MDAKEAVELRRRTRRLQRKFQRFENSNCKCRHCVVLVTAVVVPMDGRSQCVTIIFVFKAQSLHKSKAEEQIELKWQAAILTTL